MLSSTTHSESINSKAFFIDEINTHNPQKNLSAYLNNIKAEDIEKIKVYLGMVYFAVFSVISIALVF